MAEVFHVADLKWRVMLFLDDSKNADEGDKKLEEWATKVDEWEEGAYSGASSPNARLYMITTPNGTKEDELRSKLNEFYSIKEIVTLSLMM